MIEAFLWLRRIHKGFNNASICLEECIKTPLCMPKCGKCCEINTPMWTTIEAIHAISVLSGRAKIAKMTSIAEGWLVERDTSLSYNGMITGLVPAKITEEWRRVSRSRCPFLAYDKSCLVHEVRPLVCQAYGVTVDSSEICPRKLGYNETKSQVMTVDGTPLREEILKFKDYCRSKEPAWLKSSFVSSVLYRAAKPDKFTELLGRNSIPSARIIGIDIDVNLMWQPQLDELKKGMSPDMVASLNDRRRTR